VFAAAGIRLTLKMKPVVPAFPSSCVESVINSVGVASSFRIVPTPWESAIVALLGLLRLTAKFSSGSISRSAATWTVTCLLKSPGLNVSVVSGMAV
jgi:hypothetical protein